MWRRVTGLFVIDVSVYTGKNSLIERNIPHYIDFKYEINKVSRNVDYRLPSDAAS
jgi:hypothetical protein